MQLLEQYTKWNYVVTLGPGMVRYFDAGDFLLSNPNEAINYLKTLSGNLEIKSPTGLIWVGHNKAFMAQFPEEIKKLHETSPYALPGLCMDLAEYDNLFKDETWEEKLLVHHQLGRLFLKEAMPSSAYCCFFEFFRLKKHSVDECFKSWVNQAWRSPDITDSYRKSSEHLVVKHYSRDYEFEFTFSKTPFVKERLDFLTQSETERKAALDLESLRRSKFDCYIYLMEDLRNKTFKIGKSKTPGKRERTLQSEVPQIVMRFSIPAEEAREKELHERFDAKRIRGEWFELSQDDLVWLVSFLKSDGDASRSFVDFDWLGRIHFNG
jgi:hypothetical protein